MKSRSKIALTLLLLVAATQFTWGQPSGSSWIGRRPDATVDLTTREGVDLVQGQWRFSDAHIVKVSANSIGSDLKPTGPAVAANDIEPKAGAAGYDDSTWEVIEPPAPNHRRTNGRLGFAWFRIQVTIPEQVGNFKTKGTDVVFETTVDDYAEVWVNGELQDAVLGQSGGSLIKGWNSPNRVVVARSARPGRRIQLAIFAMNGPISNPPENFVWFRSATLDFFSRETHESATVSKANVVRLDPALDRLISHDSSIDRLASGFAFTEGPLWVPQRDGYLLFSDPNENTIYRLTRDRELHEFRVKSGYAGFDIGRYRQPGSNGLALDPEGRLTICQHGNRQVVRIEKNGIVTVLADRFQGKRLNSPNDLVFRSDGALIFTDPPFGLPMFGDDPAKELNFSGVYCLKDKKLNLISDDLSGPNGIAFSPDEKYLYVGNWDDKRKTVTRFEIDSSGVAVSEQTFFDMTSATGEDAIDGIKVDELGNVYVSGPGGLWILSPQGRHLGTVVPPEHPHNLAFGGLDGKTLFMTCQTGVYSMALNVRGAVTNRGTGVVQVDTRANQ